MSAATFLYFLKSFADGVFQPCRQTSKYFSYFLFHIKAVIFHRVRKSMGSFFDFFSKSTCIFRRVVYIIEIKSGYSAAWFSAFVWGTKGREFESRYPDHLQCIRNFRHSLCGYLKFRFYFFSKRQSEKSV